MHMKKSYDKLSLISHNRTKLFWSFSAKFCVNATLRYEKWRIISNRVFSVLRQLKILHSIYIVYIVQKQVYFLNGSADYLEVYKCDVVAISLSQLILKLLFD